MPSISPDETITIVIAGLVIFIAGGLNAAGASTWKSIQDWARKKVRRR